MGRRRQIPTCGIVLALLLFNIAVSLLYIQPVRASGTIYIRANGSIDPPTAPIINSDNITYTFTADINDSVIVLRSNIKIDGKGYTIQGSGSDSGLTIGSGDDLINNVTIRNINIKNFSTGIQVIRSSHNTFSENNITNNGCGIRLSGSQSFVPCLSNTISGNNIRDNDVGISLEGGSNEHKIYHNFFIDNGVQARADGPPHHDNPATAYWNDSYPSGGNYWSDYNGTDSDGDGIGDSPYIINEYNKDNYPLMKPPSPLFGDLNYDFIIDMRDIGIAAWSFGSFPTHPRWNSEADVNQDGKVDMKDIISIAQHFGET